MIRKCFLCNSEVEIIISNQWHLPGLSKAQIGFSACPNCGSICQSPTVTFDEMMKYYQTMAVYTNPGREGTPTDTKVRDLDEQICFIKRGIGTLPENVLQIGSSDGYTLSRFKEMGVTRVLGIEPGEASVDMASRLYGIECINSSAESFETKESFDLILLTHVLEHLYTPQDILSKCRKIQDMDKEAFIYVEVPLMANVESLCPGFFSFEHINYYTRENLTYSLYEAGYSPVSLVEHYNSNLSPIIGILASTKKQNHINFSSNEYEKNKLIVRAYKDKEIHYWQKCLDTITEQLNSPGRIYLWGAGVHTSQLLENTDLLDKHHIDGLLDTSSLKWGVRQGDWVCANPTSINWINGDKIIISSYASEQEIYDALIGLRGLGVETLRLHNIEDSKSH